MTLLLQVVLLWAGEAPAPQPADEALRADLAALSTAYDYGRYAEVLSRAEARMDGVGLDAATLVELHKLAGLSAFNLHRLDEAERHVAALLRLDPDFSLDPFVYPPPAVAFVEKQRRAMAAELEFLREQRRQREAAAKAAAEERAALARQTEQQTQGAGGDVPANHRPHRGEAQRAGEFRALRRRANSRRVASAWASASRWPRACWRW